MPLIKNPSFDPAKHDPICAFIADVHWTERFPAYRMEQRTDRTFADVLSRKMERCFDFCIDHNNIPLFCCGDLFDRARDFLDYFSLSRFMTDYFMKHPKFYNASSRSFKFYVIEGQHDMRNHDGSDDRTSLRLLTQQVIRSEQHNEYVKVVYKIGKEEGDIESPFFQHSNIEPCVYGMGWNSEMPNGFVPENKKRKPKSDYVNVLFCHKTLWHTTPPYPGCAEGNVSAWSQEVAKHHFDFVFSGDNHIAFSAKCGNIEFHNIGAFSRRSVDLGKQTPRMCVLCWDNEIGGVVVADIALANPDDEVFEKEISFVDKKRERDIDSFTESLAGGFDKTLSFREFLDRVIKSGECGEMKLNERQKGILNNVVGTM